MADKVRVRIAPSPTGFLHIGTARTALFNWLFARNQNGEFIVRIEDTDVERSKPEYDEDIIRSLKWLGFTWDEFYRQSERTELYKKYLEKLFSEKKAYYCFCTKDQLEIDRQAMMTQGFSPKYRGTCRGISQEEVDRRLQEGMPSTIRLIVPEKKVSFKDFIRGTVTSDLALLGDIIIAKDLKTPLYNFAVVIDDYETHITHIIRGEDHISNTSKQIALAEALHLSLPEFAHLPMILNPDRSKMSKRFNDASLKDYIEKGYLREAILNFLALLGWHPQGDKDIFYLDDIIPEFDLKRVQKGGAVFNMEKLDSLNGHYIRTLPLEELITRLKPFLPEEWTVSPFMVESVKGRMRTLSEGPELLEFYFVLPDYASTLLRWRETSSSETIFNLQKTEAVIKEFTEEESHNLSLVTERLMALTNPENRGAILWPLRAALSGKQASPSPFEITAALGKIESLRRIELALQKLSV